MTINWTAEVFCDFCADWVQSTSQTRTTGLAKEARKIGKAKGWSFSPRGEYRDLCPNCLEKFRKGEI